MDTVRFRPTAAIAAPPATMTPPIPATSAVPVPKSRPNGPAAARYPAPDDGHAGGVQEEQQAEPAVDGVGQRRPPVGGPPGPGGGGGRGVVHPFLQWSCAAVGLWWGLWWGPR
ncbi:hypothetical protein GCM10020221_36050 [Streptomyces thioluteus]|uniref:Uncharacterized protein n=1 Tax=Streptomyces thioluteus TaxID=66431 RepID=A0ABP6JME0_STRTU